MSSFTTIYSIIRGGGPLKSYNDIFIARNKEMMIQYIFIVEHKIVIKLFDNDFIVLTKTFTEKRHQLSAKIIQNTIYIL